MASLMSPFLPLCLSHFSWWRFFCFNFEKNLYSFKNAQFAIDDIEMEMNHYYYSENIAADVAAVTFANESFEQFWIGAKWSKMNRTKNDALMNHFIIFCFFVVGVKSGQKQKCKCHQCPLPWIFRITFDIYANPNSHEIVIINYYNVAQKTMFFFLSFFHITDGRRRGIIRTNLLESKQVFVWVFAHLNVSSSPDQHQ